MYLKESCPSLLLELLETFTLVDDDISQPLSRKYILKATHRAIVDGLISIGYTNEAMKLKSKIRIARLLH
ncbi:hypothetical protein Lal_00017007 [Lupinus albus]|nr:hypothetical protein Lal_00017007 [Lupinus albus]